MSTAIRLISGSAASWAQIVVNVAAQFLLVPIYLSYWSVEVYGVWLAIQGIMSVLPMLDMGHQTFMGFEFLRIGRNDILGLSKSLSSAAVAGASISLVQIIIVVLFLSTGALPFLLGDASNDRLDLMTNAGIVLIMQAITWLLGVTIGGLMVRVAATFGHYPRTAWWAFAAAILNAVTPLVAVVMGAGLLGAGLVMSLTGWVYAVFLYIDLYRLLKREKIRLIKPSLALSYSNFLKCLPLVGKTIFENIRQQGIRLFLAPLSGPAGLAAFSTMRTGANVALQGLNTIVNPMLPDLMRFLHERDQARSEAAFATIWIVVVALMAPAVIGLQLFMEPFFNFWTQGKILFDPLLFAVLSLGVLVYAVIQPAAAVVVGNNLTKTQLALQIIAGITVLIFLVILVPIVGILGAAVALLLGEITAAIGFKIYAEKWLRQHNLKWPNRAFGLAVTSVCISAASLAGLVWAPQLKWVIFGVSMIFLMWNLWRYWQVLPIVALESARNIIIRIPVVRRLVFLFD